MSLGDILRFVTGSETQLILGYGMQPTILFDEYALSCLPTSNTCINKLTLASGSYVPQEKELVFNFFDYGFTNTYFGNV